MKLYAYFAHNILLKMLSLLCSPNKIYNFKFYIFLSLLFDIFTHITAPIDVTLGEKSADDVPDKEKALVLIEFSSAISLPFCYEYDKETGKYVYTAFPRENPHYFCPASQPIKGYEDCLFPEPDEQINKCKSPVLPTIKKIVYNVKTEKKSECAHEKGILYKFVFQNKIEVMSAIKMYEICYDHNEEKVIYIYHRLLSPILLTNKLLDAERQQKYKISTYDYEYFNNRFEKSQKFYKEISDSSQYAMKFIVSPGDMAFSIWKRPTYHYINTMPVLPATAKLLNHIDEFIRTQASTRLGELGIIDGFRDFNSEVPAVWIKFVYSENKNSGIAIVIHNTKDAPSEKLCKKSICKLYNWIGLITEDMKSFAYCCEVNDLAKEFEIWTVSYPMDMTSTWKNVFKTPYFRYQYNCPNRKFTVLKYL